MKLTHVLLIGAAAAAAYYLFVYKKSAPLFGSPGDTLGPLQSNT